MCGEPPESRQRLPPTLAVFSLADFLADKNQIFQVYRITQIHQGMIT